MRNLLATLFLFFALLKPVYAAVAFVASTTSEVTSDLTSHPITLPTATTGNLITVFFASDGGPTITINTSASGNNWSLTAQRDQGGTITGVIAYKVAEGSDALTLTTSNAQRTSAVSIEWSGASGTLDASSSEGAGGSTADSDPPSHTPAGGSKEYMWVAFRAGDGTIVASAQPTGYSTLISQSHSFGAGASTDVAYLLKTASVEDPGAFTSAAEQWVAFTAAIYPTEGTPTPTPTPGGLLNRLTLMGVG